MRPFKIVLATTVCLPLAFAFAADLGGNYTVNGVDVQGGKYTGKLKVTPAGPVFRMVYQDSRTIRGMGIQRGNNLFAAWGPSDKCMVSALEIKADGTLDGPWGDLVKAKLGNDTLRKQSGAPGSIAGSYAGKGLDQEGNPYDGVATIEQRGSLFKVSYKSGGETFLGVAVQHANYLAISYGGGKCGVTAYTINGDNTMQGVYAEYGAAKTGTEQLVKGW